MSRTLVRWLLPSRSSSGSICSSCRSRIAAYRRPFSSTTAVRKPDDEFDKLLVQAATSKSSATTSQIPLFSESISATPSSNTEELAPFYATVQQRSWEENLHHLHVYATKHNTHITLTNPERQALISVSTGIIGARKAQRGTYDAAYQLGAWVMKQIPQKGADRKWYNKLNKIELVLRGFGPGREAVTKILMGSEGREIRSKIVRVTDATRLKFGGVRSPKPRRLG